MKISNYLPQFKEPCLLITAGKQEATFYVAQADSVEQVHTVKINKSKYTDREGRFDKRAGGKIIQSGSNYKEQEEELVKLMIKQVAEAADGLKAEHNIKQIYLFCPTYLTNQIEAGLSSTTQPLIQYIFYGNYHRQHPFVLLSKILEYQRQAKENRVEPIKGEAMGILKNTAPYVH